MLINKFIGLPNRYTTLLSLLLLVSTGCSKRDGVQANPGLNENSGSLEGSETGDWQVRVVSDQLIYPWEVRISQGVLIVTETDGNIVMIDSGGRGGGVMPGFATILKGQEEAILAFVYDLKKDDSKATNVAKNQAKPAGDRYLNITGYTTFIDPSGHPALSPPWGTLNALNLSTGEYQWQIPLGNDPTLQRAGAPQTGLESRSGPIVTAGGLIFISGATDQKLRALDKKTGKQLWETNLPGIANATACTYQVKGKQYVALSVGGTATNPAGFIMAFTLP